LAAWRQEVTAITAEKIDPSELPELAKKAIDAIKEKKGREIVVFDMRGFTPFVDYHVVTSAESAVQAKALLDTIIEYARELKKKARGIEGDPESGWVLVDFWDVVVHIFRPELRKYYNLEGLWGDLPSVKIQPEDDGL
jgi:ribosome-associated protein